MKVLKDFHENVVKKKLNNRFVKTQQKHLKSPKKTPSTPSKKQQRQAKKP